MKLNVVEDIYKNRLRRKYFLSFSSLKIPLLSVRYRERIVEYQVFFVLPIFIKKAKEGEAFKLLINNVRSHYPSIKERIYTRIKENKPIRVGFLIVYSGVFSYKQLYHMLNEISAFEPFILVIPDIRKNKEYLHYHLEKTYSDLSPTYQNVISSYDKKTQSFIDLRDKIDIAFFSYPYESVSHWLYNIAYISQFALTAHIPYGYTGIINSNFFGALEYSLFWKIYIENQNVLNLIERHQGAKVENCCVIGYPKMDSLYQVVKKAQNIISKKKKIVIAPHHSVSIPGIQHISLRSNFVRLSQFFLELPTLYPQIDFIFRPHQELFPTLIRHKIYDNFQGGGGHKHL